MASRGLVADWDALLRAEGDFAVGHGPLPWGRLVTAVILGGGIYGAAMGSYAGSMAALYAALKVPLLITVSMAVCWAAFYVVNAVLGLAEDFPAACRGLVSAQATFAIVLASLAPVTLFCYLVTDDYHFAKLLNGLMFGLATLGAQRTLARHYRPLLERAPRHKVALLIWPALYFFVAAQMAYALRPFVGNPGFPTEFLRQDWRGNAYVDLIWAVKGVLG